MSLKPYPHYTSSGVDRLREIPSDWHVKPLKAVASHNDEVLAEDTDSDAEIEYVDISSVDGGRGTSLAGIQPLPLPTS